MKVVAFVHPSRCEAPLGGIGRHAAEVIRAMSVRNKVEIELLVSKYSVGSGGTFGASSALPRLPVRTYAIPENLAERCWKMFGQPHVDRWLDGADWVYSPMETFLPAKRVPVAVTIHDVQMFETGLPWSQSPHHRRWRAKWSVWVHKTLRDSRVVFTVSEFSKRRIVELLGADASKIVVSGNGVGAEFHDMERKDGFAGPPYALVVGGLRKKKGGADVIAVGGELARRRAELKIVTVGLNDWELVERARECGNIEIRGPVHESELRDLLGSASTVLILSPYEGFGLPAIEGMAAGVPVVAANRASLPEAVGDAGILVEPSRHEEIAEVLLNLARDGGLRNSLVDRGRLRAREFTWERCAERVVRTLETLS